MENTAAALPDSSSWQTACDSHWQELSQTPFNRMDEWVAGLHEAVNASPVCSWEPGMKPGDDVADDQGQGMMQETTWQMIREAR